jgi:pre-mRNA-splicing factor 18
MDKFNFKNSLDKLKEQNKKLTTDKKYVRYGDVMNEKIKQNKVEKTILKSFDDIEKEREDWFRIKNDKLNKEKEEKKDKINVECEEDINVEIKNEIEIGKDISTEIKKKKEWAITINPKEVIIETVENKENIRAVTTEIFTQEYKCNELYNWFHVMFIKWEEELDHIPEHMRDTPDGRKKFGIYKQCRGYIKPLLRLLKNGKVTKVIMDKLFEIMVFCMDKDYIRAHDKYIELAIGNAPWPMGVTMVGIHERSGRSRIATSQVAHILNDDSTKKYLQSVKRIMSLVQRLNPTTPSHSVFS